MKRICETCGKEYGGQGKRFCSVNCFRSFRNKKKPKSVCEICGKEFSTIRSSGWTTCSRKCDQEKQERWLRKTQETWTQTCIRCGKEFISLYTKRRFCSRHCVIKYSGPTSIELKIASALDFLRVKHQSQYRPNKCRYIFNEAIPPNILIEIQGDYWHNLPSNTEKDERKANWAKDHGFELVVIWEHEINKHTALVLLKKRVLPLSNGHLATAKRITVKAESRRYDPIGIQLELPGILREGRWQL